MTQLRELAGRTIVVAGARVSGVAAARLLAGLGATVVLADGAELAALTPDAAELVASGMALVAPEQVALDGVALVVTSPGWRPDSPLLTAAAALGIPVWGDIELAWQADQQELFGPARTWLAITGTNGKTTTTSMLDSILAAAGIASAACGNIGLSVLDALTADTRADVLAIELSSFQLHWAPSVRPRAGVVLNVAEDHLDWHGGMAAYARAKAQALTGDIAVAGLDDEIAASLLAGAPAARAIGFRLGEPGPDELGVVDGRIIDRAFGGADSAAGIPLAQVSQIHPAGPAGTMDALAAAALARAIGVAPAAIAAGLDAHQVGPHRAALVDEIAGVAYIDDSKATNPHATRASVLAHERVVWIAGGLLKGAAVDDLVRDIAPRLVAAVLLGQDRGQLVDALRQHAPEVPIVEVLAGEDVSVSSATVVRVDTTEQVMSAAVRAGTAFAESGDTVLLAPAAASLDMYRDYGERGRSFVAAVQGLAPTAERPSTGS
ncbi:UDP-N-acetylmuramoyl-L-alanine--D-glutamate ligase [Tomitella biformata]|uniref:UDP-N-acetylmuramoyl-L-alanine--D-glutamate ligase n=1 Tax=Tomitella biformata TaxID=630403 RepID=UPI0004651682|nr:UDP-N-acetylmuramoyl-L-alanine--D-glutamate ligase [Tomitella biformata]